MHHFQSCCEPTGVKDANHNLLRDSENSQGFNRIVSPLSQSDQLDKIYYGIGFPDLGSTSQKSIRLSKSEISDQSAASGNSDKSNNSAKSVKSEQVRIIELDSLGVFSNTP